MGRGRKKPEPVEEKAKTRKPKRVAKKKGEIVRVLTDPTSGEEVRLSPYDEYPDSFKYVAKVMYISGTSGIPQISAKLDIPENTLRTWQTRGDWVELKRKVGRLASREAVQASRKAMSNYVLDMDRTLNKLMETLHDRWENVPDDKKMDDEKVVLQNILEIVKVKLAIFRTLASYGAHTKAFTPHPSNLLFDGTKDQGKTPSLTSNSAEELLETIPDYLLEAANFVIGVDENDIDPEVLDAVAKHIDSNKDDEDDDDDNIMF